MIRVLAFALLTSVSSKTYERCELAKELKYAYDVPESEVGTWVCIAEHESQYNTSAIGMLGGDGSSDHGIFQINDEYWCSPPGKGWACGLTCAELQDDDIEDDFICAKRIFREHKTLTGDGFNAWAVYKPYCQGKHVQKYVEGCFNETDEVPHPKKKVQTKKVYPWLVSKPSSTTPTPEKTVEDQSRCFIGRNNLDESIRTKAVHSEYSTLAPPNYESARTVLPPANAFTSSVPHFKSITSAPQTTKNQQILPRISNNIPPTDGRLSSSALFNSVQFSSGTTTNPLLSSVPRVTNVGTVSDKVGSSNSHFNSLTPFSESIANRPIGISSSRNISPSSPIFLRTKPASLLTTNFPGVSEATPLVSVRTVIGPNDRFASPPQRIPLTAPTERSNAHQRTSSQPIIGPHNRFASSPQKIVLSVPTERSTFEQGIPTQRIKKEPSFIINGVPWV